MEALEPAAKLVAITDAVAYKSTGTLSRWAASLRLYLAWTPPSGGAASWPPSETAGYLYVRSLADSTRTGTRALAFLQAIRFCRYLFGMDVLEELCVSARVRGAALLASSSRRPLTSKTPLRQVRLLEETVLLSSDRTGRLVAGALLLALASCARWADRQAMESLCPDFAVDDVSKEHVGFLEARVRET